MSEDGTLLVEIISADSKKVSGMISSSTVGGGELPPSSAIRKRKGKKKGIGVFEFIGPGFLVWLAGVTNTDLLVRVIDSC